MLNGSASSRYIGGGTINGGSLVFNNFSTQAAATTYIASGANLTLNYDASTTSAKTWGGTVVNQITGAGTLNTQGLVRLNTNSKSTTSGFIGTTNVQSGSLQLDIANGGICANFKQYLRTTVPNVQYRGDVTINGALKLDVTDVTDLTGSWVLLNADVLNEMSPADSFGSGFTLAFSNGDLFTNNGNVWTGEYGGKSWSFNESNATLSIVPEPGAIILLISALLGLAAYAWRRKS